MLKRERCMVLELRPFRCNIAAIQETRLIEDCVIDVHRFMLFMQKALFFIFREKNTF